ncbi:hypothetical protein FHQ18_12125 [Deferribacter autotrophicus]|uniref:DUF4194 domain-containing protein n=1 Tax=Deferribacter autotrophicus TaxID=500465 RepID=A0A5A8F1W2_9BACT|nr:hypothetical protein [Deferribacter autotrophicus]KAA0256866.1 hypothetical protein FHQ18_12125 [Deferribacter autotrophicus]
MTENSLEKLIRENNSIFRKVNYLLLDGVNISASNMPSEYAFIEENIEILSEYYEFLGYKLQNYDSNFYLSVLKKDRYTSFEYFSKSETFLGMYLSLKFFQNMEDPTFNANELFEELNSIFALEHLYEIFVKKMQNFYESDKRLETVKDNYAKTLRQLNKYNFIDIVDGTPANIANSKIEIKGSIKRFFDLALELYDKQNNEDMDIGELLNIFINETDFDIVEED